MEEKQSIILESTLLVERLVDDLRRGLGGKIRLTNGNVLIFYPFHSLSTEHLTLFSNHCKEGISLLVSGKRACSIGAEIYDAEAIVFPLNAPHIAAQTLVAPTSWREATTLEQSLLKLAKRAAVIPDLVIGEADMMSLPPPFSYGLTFDPDILAEALSTPLETLIPGVVAQVPLKASEHCLIQSFREPYSTTVHLALRIGIVVPEKPVLTRVHSSCVTGDLLGSLRCDCGDQLHLALETLAQAGGGLLIYLHQEGRGIGIDNKLHAYALQDQGQDTYDANLTLGFAEDERDFAAASVILRYYGIERVRLLTNNPSKQEALEHLAIQVTERVPLHAPTSPHNHDYLSTKATRAGHLIDP